ncbi:MAG: hypothetical protein JWP15_3151 [Alphaproteobacteria bacterium]|nr:hypothetical protein [Alphaproteobacteria bacterium]
MIGSKPLLTSAMGGEQSWLVCVNKRPHLAISSEATNVWLWREAERPGLAGSGRSTFRPPSRKADL